MLQGELQMLSSACLCCMSLLHVISLSDLDNIVLHHYDSVFLGSIKIPNLPNLKILSSFSYCLDELSFVDRYFDII